MAAMLCAVKKTSNLMDKCRRHVPRLDEVTATPDCFVPNSSPGSQLVSMAYCFMFQTDSMFANIKISMIILLDAIITRAKPHSHFAKTLDCTLKLVS